MDSFVDKLGLYDAIGVFLSGTIVTLICKYLNIYDIYSKSISNNNVMDIINILLICYVIGLVLQEISSFLEKKIFHFRDNASTNFLNYGNDVISNPLELQKLRNMAKEILKDEFIKENYTKQECEFVFIYCKTFLEIKKKNEKENRINSLYAMSRSLTLALLVVLVLYIAINEASFEINFFLPIFIMILLICLFYRRCERFSKYRVRVILRQYYLLKL